MNTRPRFVLTLIVLALVVLATGTSTPVDAAGPWYVSPSGNDSNSCQNPDTPCATIQGAIDKANSGETIFLNEGVYMGSGDKIVFIDKNLTLSGGWDAQFIAQTGTSIVDGQGERRGIFIVDGAIAIIEYVTVRNGFSTINEFACGSGILNWGDLTLDHVDITSNGNHEMGASGICNYGKLLINNSSIRKNKGSGIINSYFVTTETFDEFLLIRNSSITENESQDSGGGIHVEDCSPVGIFIVNTTISSNKARFRGGGIYAGPGDDCVSIYSSTVSSNEATDRLGQGGGIYADWVILANSILAGNIAYIGQDCMGTFNESRGYNLIHQCNITTTEGDILGDPELAPLTGSPAFHPLPRTSPAINSGNPSGCKDHQENLLDADQRGVARVGRCDIGSYEYDPASSPYFYSSLPVVIRNYCSGFIDDFSDPQSGWYVGEEEFELVEYRDGEYRTVAKSDEYVFLYSAPTCVMEDYIVEVDARWEGTSGDSYSLLFDVLGDYNYYYLFSINTDFQGFGLFHRNPSGWTELVPPTFSSAIHPGEASNHLKVSHIGGNITLEINDVVLGTWFDLVPYNPGWVGVAVMAYEGDPGADARFDNFRLTRITSATSLDIIDLPERIPGAASPWVPEVVKQNGPQAIQH